jgi:hypothetical protein
MKSELPVNRILHLTLKADPFDVMLKGEKRVEYRKPSQWLNSRINPQINPQEEYDLIKFVNGYGADSPFFVAVYLGWEIHEGDSFVEEFSNGLVVTVQTGTVKIFLGSIIESGNLKQKM